jgi:hypothetical protein
MDYLDEIRRAAADEDEAPDDNVEDMEDEEAGTGDHAYDDD